MSGIFSSKVSIAGLSMAGGYAVAILTMAGFFGRWFDLFDLMAHFRCQYGTILVVYLLAALYFKHKKSAGVFFLALIINLFLIAPFYFSKNPSVKPGEQKIKLLLVNVNTRAGNPSKILKLIAEQQPDLIILQEISSRWLTDIAELQKNYPFSISRPREDNFGIALFSRLPLPDSQIIDIGQTGIPSIETRLSLDSSSIQVLAVHPTPPIGQDMTSRRNLMLAELGEIAAKRNSPLIIVGDLNTSPWGYHFKNLIEKGRLLDSACGHGISPTWPSNHLLLQIPIDHFLHSSEIRVLSRQVCKDTGSDHFGLAVEFCLNQTFAQKKAR
ncbi:MAG: endonuclease/exonuclease/phosphatase family protein [Candidatus Riflebacteria bacterium]